MPLPYRGDKHVTFAAMPMLEHPALAARIAAIGTLWTAAEDLWSAILGMMVGVGQAAAGMEMYHSLTGTGAQRALLNEMADRYLPTELKADYANLLKATKKRGGERNDVVHGLWFFDPKQPEVLILAPRNTISTVFKASFVALRDGRRPDVDDPSFTENSDKWLVYREHDFDNIIDRIIEFAKDLDHFFDQLTLARGYPTIGPPARPPQSGSS